MGATIAVAGASGYAGGELLRLLAAHPGVELGPLAAGSSAGTAVGSVHPQLRSLADRSFVETSAERLVESDLVILALPHGESARLVAQLPEQLPVVDLGADFRLRSGTDWQAHYGTPHAGHWAYGLPELPGGREALGSASRVANPGCYATAVPLALAPLLHRGLVAPEDIVVVAASGTSGAGRAAKAALLGSEVMGDLAAYKVAAHQHVPEMRQSLGDAAGGAVNLSFTSVLAPMPRGILATCTARLVDPNVDEQALREALVEQYAAEPFIHVLAPGQWPHTAATLGSNSCHLQLAVDRPAGRVVVVAALDNLVKGAAGQAIQNANRILGLHEADGLPVDGVAP